MPRFLPERSKANTYHLFQSIGKDFSVDHGLEAILYQFQSCPVQPFQYGHNPLPYAVVGSGIFKVRKKNIQKVMVAFQPMEVFKDLDFVPGLFQGLWRPEVL